MTEITQVSPAIAESKTANPMEMVVETNHAPTERKSVELVTTEPKTPELQVKIPEIKETAEPIVAATPADKTVEQKADELARARFDERLRADNAERELAKLKPQEKLSSTPPDIHDQSTWGEKYAKGQNTLEQFLKARDEWVIGNTKAQAAAEAKENSVRERNIKIQGDVSVREDKARAKYSDYNAVVTPLAPIIGSIPLLKQFIAERESGVEVAYNLAKNPALLDQLSRMTPFQAGEFLFSLETRLKTPANPQITEAPEPIKPVGSRDVASKPTLANLASKDINGYIKLRNKQELERKRAH